MDDASIYGQIASLLGSLISNSSIALPTSTVIVSGVAYYFYQIQASKTDALTRKYKECAQHMRQTTLEINDLIDNNPSLPLDVKTKLQEIRNRGILILEGHKE